MLFKALLIVGLASAPPVELGPFSSHAQCMEAAKAILAPNSTELKVEGSTISGLTTYVSLNGFGRKDYGLGARITCYEVAP